MKNTVYGLKHSVVEAVTVNDVINFANGKLELPIWVSMAIFRGIIRQGDTSDTVSVRDIRGEILHNVTKEHYLVYHQYTKHGKVFEVEVLDPVEFDALYYSIPTPTEQA